MASLQETSVQFRHLFFAAPIMVLILLNLGADTAKDSMTEMGSADMQGMNAMGEAGENPTNASSSAQLSQGTYRNLTPTQVNPDLQEEVFASAAEIDRLVLAKLKSEKIRPNPKLNDMQFVRRIYLDITGTIPTAQQASQFLNKSRSGNKRADLIDELLNSFGYVSNSFNYWADILRLKDQPNGNIFSQPYNEWIKDTLASDLPYNEFVHQLLSAEGRTWENPAVGYVLRDAGMPLANLDNTIRIFLGTRIGCAQCHDHPFDRWTQLEFYHLAAFVNGIDTNAGNRQVNPVVRDAVAEINEQAKKRREEAWLAGSHWWPIWPSVVLRLRNGPINNCDFRTIINTTMPNRATLWILRLFLASSPNCPRAPRSGLPLPNGSRRPTIHDLPRRSSIACGNGRSALA